MSGFMPSPLPRKSVWFTWWNAGGREVFRTRRRRSVGQYPRAVLLLVTRAQGGLLDLHQELDVVAGLLQLVQQQFQRLLRLPGGGNPAPHYHGGELPRGPAA